MDFLLKLISSFFTMFVVISMWYKLLGKKIDYRNKRIYLVILLLGVISVLNYYVVNQFIRILIITFVLILCYRFLLKEKINKVILTPIYTQLIIMISEFVYILSISLIFDTNVDALINSYFGSLMTNIMVPLIAILIYNINFTKKIYDFLITSTDKIKSKHLIFLSLFLVALFNILSMAVYYNLNYKFILIFNTIIITIVFFIVLYSFKTQNNYIKVYDKYNTTLNSLKEYEDILDRYRVSNHENKNQLLTIRNMVSKSDKKTISYIDKIVENKLKDNDKVMFEISIIPAGGLRGLIYSKVLTMKDSKINYELEISNSVKTVDLISLDDSLMLDICQIIGVYLDNAIEEVKRLEEKYINIEMYIEEKELIIEITNNYKGKIDIEKIEDKGYTSKGKGHGYGLTLVKEILSNNKKLSNQKKISKENFTQVLKIKM